MPPRRCASSATSAMAWCARAAPRIRRARKSGGWSRACGGSSNERRNERARHWPGPGSPWRRFLSVALVGGLGRHLQLVIDLIEQLLGFGGVAVHVPLVGFLRRADLLPRIAREALCGGEVWMPLADVLH